MSEINVEENLGLVWDVIHRLFGGGTRHRFMGFEREDLFQVGCIGLMKAVERHEESKGSFPTYAFNCIYGEIRKEIRDSGMMVKFPRTANEIVAKICKQDRKHTITIDEIINEFELNEKYAQMVMVRLHYKSVSGSTIVSSDGNRETTLIDTIEDEEQDIAREVVDAINLEERLSILGDRDQKIVRLGLEGLTQKEIASKVGLSQISVSRILKRSVDKIQKRFDSSLAV